MLRLKRSTSISLCFLAGSTTSPPEGSASCVQRRSRRPGKISYRIPAFKLNGMLVYFGAFTKPIGFYPPIRGDSRLEKALSRYAGEKGNLRFPLDQPIPYGLIKRIVKLKVKQNRAKAAARGRKGGK